MFYYFVLPALHFFMIWGAYLISRGITIQFLIEPDRYSKIDNYKNSAYYGAVLLVMGASLFLVAAFPDSRFTVAISFTRYFALLIIPSLVGVSVGIIKTKSMTREDIVQRRKDSSGGY